MRNYYDPTVLSFFIPFCRTFSFLNIFLSEKEFHPFPSSLSSSSLTYVTPSPDSHNSLLKSMDSLSLIIVLYIYVCLCVCKYANTSCSVCFGCLCVCVWFQDWSTCIGWWREVINLLSAVISFPQIFVYRWSPAKFYPLLFKMSIGIPMCWSCLYRRFWERLFHSTLPYILALKVFLPTLSRRSMIHRCRSCDVDVSFGAVLP